ncbi:hypothetical protein M5689_021220 [Euphorbia peplus]|nr:hypothetical protein M5689_021220 [Euphorbia peplus]
MAICFLNFAADAATFTAAPDTISPSHPLLRRRRSLTTSNMASTRSVSLSSRLYRVFRRRGIVLLRSNRRRLVRSFYTLLAFFFCMLSPFSTSVLSAYFAFVSAIVF